MLGPDLKELDPQRAIVLDNETCVYCAVQLDVATSTADHAIGRRFVPKGKLAGCWNLIVRACETCNRRKAGLEDDISAITMQPDAWGRHARQDEVLVAESARKAAGSMSRRTRKPVGVSSEALSIQVSPIPGATFNFSMISAPQVDEPRAFELASFQLRAFFYFITYNHATRRGGFWLGEFIPVQTAQRADWGNPIQRAFMKAVVHWEPRVIAIGADRYFKAAIRRHPGAEFWSWGLEWNHNLRLIGFMGQEDTAAGIVRAFPRLETTAVPQPDGSTIRYRLETALAEGDDTLFNQSVTALTDPIAGGEESD